MFAALEDRPRIDTLTLKNKACIMQAMAQRMRLRIAPWNNLAIQPDAAVAIIERYKGHLRLLQRTRPTVPHEPDRKISSNPALLW
jgi:hypothetical protein